LPRLKDAERYAPVGVLIGVLTIDKEAGRRQLIRSIYGSAQSVKEGTEGVRVVFVLGRPAPKYADAVALEMESKSSRL
jgi:hypothetical protein